MSSDGARDPSAQRQRLRGWVLAGAVAQVLVWLFIGIYIGHSANPKGDGMEWVGMVPATLVLLAFGVPTAMLGASGRLLAFGALLAGSGVVVNLLLLMELAREFSH